MFKKVKLKNFPIVLLLISIAISPAFALGEGNRNLLLIGIMAISPISLFFQPRFYSRDILLSVFIVTIILHPFLFNPESIRWSTVLYSVMFCLTFMAYLRLLNSGHLGIESYLKILKHLIYSYFFVLVIQQICVLLNLPIFNLSNYNPEEPWKLNSLAAEPSHSARIVAFLMFCYLTVKEIISQKVYEFKLNYKTDKWVWLAFFWTMLTMGSASAFLFIPIVLLKFVNRKNLAIVLVLSLTIIVLIGRVNIKGLERTKKTFSATLTLDKDQILDADRSAAVRIVPLIVAAEIVELNSLNGWFGNGIDYVSTFMYEEVPGTKEGLSGGGLFQLWLEYGFISFILFVLFSLSSSYRKGDYISIIFWFMLVFLYGINNQIVWLCIFLLYTNKYFSNNINKIKNAHS